MLKKMSLKRSTLLLTGLCLLFGRYAASFLLSPRKNKSLLRKIPTSKQQYITCPSGNVWYAEFDGPEDGQPIVLIHGLQSSLLQWYYQQKHLRNTYRLILVDLPGHGHSDTAKSLSLQILAADLKYFMQELSINNPILYGHSIGGMILLRFAINNQSIPVKGLILQNCSYTNPMKTCLFPWFMQIIEMPFVVPFLEFAKRHSYAFNLLSKLNYLSGLSIILYRCLLFSGAQSAQELRQICRASMICSAEVSAAGILNSLRHETGPSLHLISSNCLVIGGKDDRIIRPQTALHIATHVQNGQAKILPGGHLNLIEYADQVNLTVDNFLNTLG